MKKRSIKTIKKRQTRALPQQQETDTGLQFHQKLLAIGQEILRHQNVEEILRRVAQGIREHSPFKLAAISLYEMPIDPSGSTPERISKIVISGLSKEEELKLQSFAQTGEFVSAKEILSRGRPLGGGYYVNPVMIPEIIPKGVKGKACSQGPNAWGPYDDFYLFLWQGHQILGRISLGDPAHGRVPDAEELEPLNLFANFAALALDKALRLEEIQEFQRKLQGIYQWSERLAKLDDFETLAKEILQVLVATFDYDHASIFLAEGSALLLSGFDSKLPLNEFLLDNFKKLDSKHGIVGRAAAKRKPILVGDVTKDKDYVLGHPAIRSEIAVPVVDGTELLGVLNLESGKFDAFDHEDLQLLSALTRQLAVAIKAIQRRRELNWVNRFLQGLNQASDLKTMLEIVIHHGMELLGSKADGGSCLIRNDELGVFCFEAAVNRDLEKMRSIAFPENVLLEYLSTSIQPQVLSRSQLKLSSHFDGYERQTGQPLPASMIALPIRENGRLIAVLHLTNLQQENIFTEQDAKSLWNLVSEIELAITRARDHTRLKEMAIHDALTGTFNRHYFTEFMEEASARATKRVGPISLVMLDIDNFFKVNDQFGHSEGDRVLQAVAKLLRNEVRKPDCVVRYGGDEFLIIMPETRQEDAEKVMERLRKRFEKWKPHLPELQLAISFGVASWDPHGTESLDAVLEKADQFMYHRRKARRETERTEKRAMIGAAPKEQDPK